MIDSQPDLAPLIKRVRGGYLKIQGTWMPYEVRWIFSLPQGHYRSSLTSGRAPTLSPVRESSFLISTICQPEPRVAYNIREDLVPLFGYVICTVLDSRVLKVM